MDRWIAWWIFWLMFLVGVILVLASWPATV